MAKKEKYKLWEIRDFSAGQVEKLNDNILPDNAAHECRNFVLSKYGGLEKRKGQTRLNSGKLPAQVQGLHPYYARSANIRKLIAFAQGNGYQWDGTSFSPIVSSDLESILGDPSFPLYNACLIGETMYNHEFGDRFPLDPTEPVLFEDAVTYVVAMNGIDKPWKWAGSYVTDLANAPLKGKYPVLHKEKLFCVDGDNPSTIRWSDSFEPETWPAVNYWDIRKGDGDEITNLIRFVDDLIIFKNRSIHALKGTSLDDFYLQEVHSRIGCVGPRAAAVHDLKIFFVSEWGIYITNGLNVTNISEMIIPDLWDTVNQEYLHKACVTVWKEMVRIDLPTGTSDYNNLTLFYDAKNQAFWPADSINVSCYATYNDGSGEGIKLYSGDATQGYVNIQHQGNEDFGKAINAYWKGKYFDMGMPEAEKKSRKMYLQNSPDTTETMDLSVSIDYGDYEDLEYSRADRYSREYKFDIDNNRWRYISPQVTHNSTGNCEVRGIVIPYAPRRVAMRRDE